MALGEGPGEGQNSKVGEVLARVKENARLLRILDEAEGAPTIKGTPESVVPSEEFTQILQNIDQAARAVEPMVDDNARRTGILRERLGVDQDSDNESEQDPDQLH